ncbi:serine hydrolase [Winogradskyella sp.]|uniref:serine hydrolase n=1 Tax=Winogradskyella sp. TaxID=1883156 RepID=UPI003BABFEB6
MRITTVFIALLLCNGIFAQKSNKVLNEGEQDLIDYLFSDCTPSKPGASVWVISKGDLVYETNYGLANVGQGTKIDSNTNFRIASVTKQFTAACIMILVKNGQLNYTTNLRDIFPDFPEYGKNITIRHLLTHQSGIVDYNGFIEESRTKQLLDYEILEFLKQSQKTYFEPGTSYRYSNSGYAVLAQVIEKVSGISFATFVKREIFETLGMHNSMVFQQNQNIENRAFGYAVVNDSIRFNDQSITSAIQGDGGIYCSTSDYYKWDQALYKGELIPKKELEDAFIDWDNHSKTTKDGEGYGWFVEYQNGIKILHHSGGTAGFESQVIRIPDLELSIVLFSNRNWSSRNLRYKVRALASIFSEYKIPMPIEIVLKKEIEQNGILEGIDVYHTLKHEDHYKTKALELYYLGIIYLNQHRNKASKAVFKTITLDFPSYANAYYGLGIAYKRMNETKAAINSFKKAIELSADKNSTIATRSKQHLSELSGSN